MANNVNVVLSGVSLLVIQTLDSTTRVNSALGSPTLAANESTYIDYLPIASGAGTSLTLPAATIWVLAIRNLGGINGTPSGNIQVVRRATGGALPAAADSVMVLPGGVDIHWDVSEAAGGIIAVTLVASVANTPAEILMAA